MIKEPGNGRILHMSKGFKEIFRQPVRCFLFLLLLVFVAAAGCLGISLWQTAEQLLDEAGAQYITRVTFSGGENGQAAWDEDAILADSAVIYTNEVVRGAGEIMGISNPLNEETKELAILSFQVVDISESPQSADGENRITKIMALTQSVLYGDVRTQQYIFLDIAGEQPGFTGEYFEAGHTYFGYGTCRHMTGNYPVFTVMTPEWKAAQAAGADISVLPPLCDITESGEPANMELWQQFADTLRRTEALYPVYALDAAELWDEFYEKRAELADGEFFDAGADGECLINDRFAAKHGLIVGDELALRFFYREDGTAEQLVWGEEEADSAVEYRITGIYRYQDELENAIYITRPREASQRGGGNVLQVRLKNDAALRFVERYGASLPAGTETDIRDQGYAKAIAPVKAMRRQAMELTVLGVLVGIAAMTFVGRNFYGHTAAQLECLRELGGSRRDCLWYLAGGQVFVVTAGGATGFAVQLCMVYPLMTWLLERNSAAYTADFRYSQLAGTGGYDIAGHAGGFPAAGLLFVLFMEILMFALAYRHCGSMQDGGLRETAKGRKMAAEGRKSCGEGIHNAMLRFGVQEFWRSPKQSAVFLLLAFLLTGLVGALRLAGEQQEISLTQIYEQQEIYGYVTAHAARGKADTTIAMTAVLPMLQNGETAEKSSREFGEKLLQEVYWKSLGQEESCRLANDFYREWKASLLAGQDFIEDFGLGRRLGYEYMGVSETAEKMPDIPFHTNAYGNDWLLNKIPSMPGMVFADNFAYLEGVDVSGVVFAEGYGEDFLGRSEMICMVSEGFLEENGLSLEDEVRFAVYTDRYGPRLAVLDLKIVGTYEGSGTDVCLPAGLLYGIAFLPDTGYDSWQEKLDGYRGLKTETIRTFYGCDMMNELSSFRFSVRDNQKLDEFRERLGEIGYSERSRTHGLRQIVVIEDGMFLELLSRVQTNRERLEIMFRLLLGAMFGIIAAAAFLCVNQRREEISLMAELGTPTGKILGCWLIRYGMAVLGGMIPGMALCKAAALCGGYAFPAEWFLPVFAEFAGMLFLAVYVMVLRIRKSGA